MPKDYTREHQIEDILAGFADDGRTIVAFDDDAEVIVVIARETEVYRCDIGSDDDAMYFYSIPAHKLTKIEFTPTGD